MQSKMFPELGKKIDMIYWESNGNFNDFVKELQRQKCDSVNYEQFIFDISNCKCFKLNGFEMLFKYHHWEKMDEDFFNYLKINHSDFLVSHGLIELEKLSIDFVRSHLLLQEEQIL